MAAEAAVVPEGAPAAVAAPVAAPALGATAPEPGKATAAKPAKAKPAKSKNDGKAGKEAKGAPADGAGPSIAGHPRAVRSVARAKSWGALIGFLVGGYFALPMMTVAEAGARALIAGVVCYLAAWAGAVFVWRHIVVIELKGKEQELAAAHAAARARAELPGGPPSPADPSRAR